MTEYPDGDGGTIQTPTQDEVQKIIDYANRQITSDFCNHPSDYAWSEAVLKLALFIEQREAAE